MFPDIQMDKELRYNVHRISDTQSSGQHVLCHTVEPERPPAHPAAPLGFLGRGLGQVLHLPGLRLLRDKQGSPRCDLVVVAENTSLNPKSSHSRRIPNGPCRQHQEPATKWQLRSYARDAEG